MSAPARTAPPPAAEVVRAAEKPRLKVALANPVFTDMVLSDVDRVRRTAVGRAAFRHLRDLGQSVVIEKPPAGLDPPNAWTALGNRREGKLTDLVIAYDPADWPCAAWPGSEPSDVVLFGCLVEAGLLAMRGEGLAEADPNSTVLCKNYLEERRAFPEPIGSMAR